MSAPNQAPLQCRVDRADGRVVITTGGATHLAGLVHSWPPLSPLHPPSKPTPGPSGRAPSLQRNQKGALQALLRDLLPQQGRTGGRSSSAGLGSGLKSGPACIATVAAPEHSPPGQFLLHPAVLAASAALPCSASSCQTPAGTLAACAAFQVEVGVPEALPSSAHAVAGGGGESDGLGLGLESSPMADMHCAAARLAGAVLAPLPHQAQRPARGPPAYQLLWQALPLLAGTLPDPPAPTRWLILSRAPWPLARLCSDMPAWLVACNLVYQPLAGEAPAPGQLAAGGVGEPGGAPAGRSGLWGAAWSHRCVSGDEQLEAALAAADADHIFCMQAPGSGALAFAPGHDWRAHIPSSYLCRCSGLLLVSGVLVSVGTDTTPVIVAFAHCLQVAAVQETTRCCGRSGLLCVHHRAPSCRWLLAARTA